MFKKVSFTGIDNKTNIKRLLEIAKKYPNTEFGFLVSEANTNKNTNNRYPNLILLQQLKNKNINLALHVCGKLARTVAKTGSLDCVKEFMGSYFDIFQRIQLNLVGNTVTIPITDTYGKQVIIQTNLDEPKSRANYELYEQANVENIVYLSDKSGGHGEVTDFDFFDKYQGFAGGLNPENILDRKADIDMLVDYDYWLDMESGVRTNDWFDLDKVEDICRKIF